MIKTIKSDFLTVELDTFGAEIKSVKDINGKEFIWEGDPKIWGRTAPIMFPICSGLHNDTYTYLGKEYTLAKHGFGPRMEFELEESTENSATMLLCSNEETLASYPFEFEFRAIFTVLANSILVTYSVKNLTSGEMYFSVGGHEAYATPEGIEEYEILFDEKETLDSYLIEGDMLSYNKTRIVTDSHVLPLREEYFELDALIFKNHKSNGCTLQHKNGTRKIRVDFPGFKYLLLWHMPEAKYMCIEPWTGITDPVDSDFDITHKEGITKLPQGGEYSISHKITFSA